MPAAIEVRGLCKTFRLPHVRHTTLTERVLDLFRPIAYERFEALRDIDLTIEEEAFVGIIGPNGSGKSTLLKVIAGLLVADAGTVRVNGAMCALLELGLGFSPELTVFENVTLYATVLGFPRRDLRARVEQAIEFAGLERFHDAKLKNLSTGMCSRLGFATALQTPFDILLLDEILAVGDAEFQQKCLHVFADLRRQHKTIVLVTHDLGSVQRLCDQAFFMHRGRLSASGEPDRVIASYMRTLAAEVPEAAPVEDRADRWGDGRIRFTAGWLEDETGMRVTGVAVGTRATVVLVVEAAETVEEPVFGMIVQERAGAVVYVFNTLQRRISTGTLHAGEKVEIRMPFTVALRNGRYDVHPAVADRAAITFHDWANHFIEFDVQDSTCREGLADLHAGFYCQPLEDSDEARGGAPVEHAAITGGGK